MRRWISAASALALACGFFLAPVAARAQEAAGSVTIVTVDTEQFPALEVYLAVSDARGNRLAGLPASAFNLVENGARMTGLTVAPVDAGMQVVFVLDPTAAFKARDVNAQTRLDYVRRAIFSFLKDNLRAGLDDVSILTPERALAAHASTAGEAETALTLYETAFSGAADPFPLINQALDFASDPTPRAAMQRVVIFFSNGLPASQTLATETDLAARAAAIQVPIYTVYVGPAGGESAPSAQKLNQLAEMTGGAGHVFDGPESLLPLFEQLSGRRGLYQLSYRSALSVTGQHRLSAQVGLPDGALLSSAEALLPLRVEPPLLSLPGLPVDVRRSAPGSGSTASAAEPAVLEISLRVDYPDGHARQLRQVELLVDGQPITTQSGASITTISWPLASYVESRAYALQVRVTDELGLVAQSDVITVALNIDAAVEAASAPAAPAETSPAWRWGLLGGVLSGTAGIAAAAIWLWRRRNMRPAVARPPAVPAALDMTQPARPEAWRKRVPQLPLLGLRIPGLASRPQSQGRAYLEIVAAGEGTAPRQPIEMLGQSLRLGRDSTQSDVVFGDPSVSRLHARVGQEGDSIFRLYDEGSTSGTWVNFTQIPTENGQILYHGDLINLGRVQLRFQRRDEVPAAVSREAASPQTPAAPSAGTPKDHIPLIEPVKDSPTAAPQKPPIPAPGSPADAPKENAPLVEPAKDNLAAAPQSSSSSDKTALSPSGIPSPDSR